MTEKNNPENIKRIALMWLQDEIHDAARQKGLWPELDNLDTEKEDSAEIQEMREKINVAEKLALIHLEISEALEADRQPIAKYDEHCPAFSNFAIELADAAIRIFDLAGALGIPLGSAILAKMNANKKREYKHGNKKY